MQETRAGRTPQALVLFLGLPALKPENVHDDKDKCAKEPKLLLGAQALRTLDEILAATRY